MTNYRHTFVPDLVLHPAASLKSRTIKKSYLYFSGRYSFKGHCYITCGTTVSLTVYRHDVPAIVSPYLRQLSSPEHFARELRYTLISGKLISLPVHASVQPALHPAHKKNYNTIISQNSKQHFIRSTKYTVGIAPLCHWHQQHHRREDCCQGIPEGVTDAGRLLPGEGVTEMG